MILYKPFLLVLVFSVSLAEICAEKEKDILLQEILSHDTIFVVKNEGKDGTTKLAFVEKIRGKISTSIEQRVKITEKLPIKKNQRFLCLFWKDGTREFRMMKINSKNLVCTKDHAKVVCVSIEEIKTILNTE